MRVFRPTYTDRATGAKRESGTYRVEFKDHMDRRQRVTGRADHKRTTSLALKLQKLVDFRRTGRPFDDYLNQSSATKPESALIRSGR